MSDVIAERFYAQENGDFEEALTELSVEAADVDATRGINLHVSPGKEDVVTCSLSPGEAWTLARELARAAATVEFGND